MIKIGTETFEDMEKSDPTNRQAIVEAKDGFNKDNFNKWANRNEKNKYLQRLAKEDVEIKEILQELGTCMIKTLSTNRRGQVSMEL